MRGKRLKPKDWPFYLRGQLAVAGVFVGGCVLGRRAGRDCGNYVGVTVAHAHVSGDGEGWICYRDMDHLGDREIALHELAHLMTKRGHTATWRRLFLWLLVNR